MKRTTGIGAVLAAAALAACLFAVGCAGETGSADNAITVSAASAAEVAPDTASIAFTVTASGDTEADATAAGERVAGDMVARLHSIGIAEGMVKTSGVKLSERYGTAGVTYETVGYEDYDGNWVETVEEVYYDDTETVVGYDSRVRVRVSDFAADQFGQIVREAVSMGASNYGGLTYQVSDRETAYQQALGQAVEAAHVKAESLAKAGGVYVGRVVNLVENSSVPETLVQEVDAGFIDPANPASFEVIPDKIPVEASVTISYAIS